MFEVISTDLGGRLGRLATKSGLLKTPALLPVVHPVHQRISLDVIRRIGFQAVMTNAYLTLKHHGVKAAERGIHSLIEFEGIIMTDSGGYQVLEYGDVDVDPKEMTQFQEKIGSDIAIVLDRPTGIGIKESDAKRTVDDTLKAAEITVESRSDSDTLWVGPIQGGRYLNLIEYSSKEVSRLPFDLYALGSPVEVMEAYDYLLLARMIMTAKMNLPLSKPLHLFGAGHPLTISLAISLGCDTFDSASYILYAKNGRYMTESGTSRLEDLSYFDCSCEVCQKYTPSELLSAENEEKVSRLAIHNLYALIREVNSCKKAVAEGRLWEHLLSRLRCHPKLWNVLIALKEGYSLLEDGTPVFKKKAPFIFTRHDLIRPEVVRAKERLQNDIRVSSNKRYLLILRESEKRPFYRSQIYKDGLNRLGSKAKLTQICFLSSPWGLVPVELSDIYPFSQCTKSMEFEEDPEILNLVRSKVQDFIICNSFRKVFITSSTFRQSPILEQVEQSLKSRVEFELLSEASE